MRRAQPPGFSGLKHELTGRRAQIQIVAKAYERDTIGGEIGKSVDQVLEGPAETIHFQNENCIEPPGGRQPSVGRQT